MTFGSNVMPKRFGAGRPAALSEREVRPQTDIASGVEDPSPLAAARSESAKRQTLRTGSVTAKP